MKWRERMICANCAPKLREAEMTCRRVPGKDDVAVCAFCGIFDKREKPCKCWQIATELNKP